jgi:hypothetical protein
VSLISHGTLLTGETPERCAERWRSAYGLERAWTLTQVFQKHPCKPLRAYYRTVAQSLDQKDLS